MDRIQARNTADYEAPIGLTADPVVFTLVDSTLSVLLARRLEEPQRGMFALPGGFVGVNESPEQTAERKLREKTGVGSVHLEQLRTYAEPDRDPRGWLPSIAYMALVAPEALPAEGPAGREASWHALEALPDLALDHARIVDDAVWRLHARVADKAWFVRVAGGLLPDRFTLSQAQRLYEALRGEAVDPANFRRDVRATGLLSDTGTPRARAARVVYTNAPDRSGGLTAQVLSRTIGVVPRFDATKTLEDQVTEIEKLVSDAQQQLRQVSYALETLKSRIDALAAASRD